MSGPILPSSLACLTFVSALLADPRLIPANIPGARPESDPARVWASERVAGMNAAAQGDNAGAVRHHAEALRAAESFGTNDLRLENSLTELGSVIQAEGKSKSAEPFLLRALAIREAVFGTDSLDVAFARNNLSAVYLESGQLEKARRLQAPALDAAERKLASADPRLIPYLTNSGNLQLGLKNYALAEQLLRRALSLAEDQSNAGYVVQTRILNFLGRVYAAGNRSTEAEVVYFRALNLKEAALGMDHPGLTPLLSNLGDLFASQRNFAKALPHLERAVSICDKSKVRRSLACLLAANNLASVEVNLNKAAQAEEHARYSASGLEETLGHTHTLTATALNNLGQAYLRENRFKEAESALTQARDIWKITDGPVSLNYATALSNLGSLEVSRRRNKRGERLHREALAIDVALLGPAHPKVAQDLNRLGVSLFAQKKYVEAEVAIRRALEAERSRAGEGNPALADPILNLAAVVQDQNRPEEALTLYREGISLMTAAGRNRSAAMAIVLDRYSHLLRQKEQYADAEQAATEALGIRVREALKGTYR